jgi:hypothetical protein
VIEKKTVYSIDEVREICKVSPRTAIGWFDSGKLKGYRVPGSQERRIPYDRLIAFMKEYNLIIPDELKDEDVQT